MPMMHGRSIFREKASHVVKLNSRERNRDQVNSGCDPGSLQRERSKETGNGEF